MRRPGQIRTLTAGALAGLIALTTSTALPQQPAAPAAPIPQFPPGPNFAGVAGTAAENARIAAVCGPNRNAQDGYAPAPAFAGQTKAPIVRGAQGYAVESVARIERPWAMAFLPNGKMLVSFRNGGMRTVTREGLVSEPISGVPQMVQPRLGSGMYGVILDRDFARNRRIFFAYHTRMEGDPAPMGRVASARLSEDEKSLTEVRTLRQGADMQPRAIVQGRDGTLFILSGDVTDTGVAAQNLTSQAGKVLRINPDGSVPPDNPYVTRTDANPAVWAQGYRDIHSAIIHPATGELWVVENVPRGGDELDIMRKGRNYGFGQISYGRQNSGAMINGGKTQQEGMEQPLYYWNPSIAPAGLMVYTGNAFPGWRNNVFVGGMSGMQVSRLVMDGEKVVGEEKLLMDRCQRIKHIEQGPDGFIYILTDQMPPAQNEILRLVPAPAPPPPRTAPAAPPASPPAAPAPAAAPAAAPSASAEQLELGRGAYARACAGCHAMTGGGGLGPNIAGRKDEAEVMRVIRQGQGAMPPMGSSLTAAEIEAIAKHVARLAN